KLAVVSILPEGDRAHDLTVLVSPVLTVVIEFVSSSTSPAQKPVVVTGVIDVNSSSPS
ncbi:hypothetical protein KSS87_018336, partial [Heliosperma pusillum]